MTASRISLRSLAFFWRTHLGVALGTALATLVLAGALFVGDSVKATLRAQAEARVGKVHEAFIAGERFVWWDSGKRIAPVGGLPITPDSAGILLLQGTVARPDGAARANRAQIIGVDDAFWKLSPSGKVIALPEGQFAVNEQLALQLQAQPGEDLLIRLEKPNALSKDAPLSGEESDVVTIRGAVATSVSDADFGRFALTSGQVPPPTLFVSIATLQSRLGLDGKVNVVMQPESAPRAASNDSADLARQKLADADVQIRELPGGLGIEARTSRVFLDPGILEAAQKNERAHQLPAGLDALTYFVTELRAGDGTDPQAKATPYSMITALDAPASGFVPAELADNEITITRWLADDLGVDVGSLITLKYFVMGERRQLIEKTRAFEVLGPILEMTEPQLNTSWMPDFPNVPDKGSFSSWRPGFPFDSSRIRKKDEDYWDQHRGTPKAFVGSPGTELEFAL